MTSCGGESMQNLYAAMRSAAGRRQRAILLRVATHHLTLPRVNIETRQLLISQLGLL